MKEKNENKLDQLFRDGMSAPEDRFAFREEDWDAMELLLDKKPNRKAGLFRIIYYASGIAALLLLALGLYFYNKKEPIEPTKLQVKINKTTPDTSTHNRDANLPYQAKGKDTLYQKAGNLAAGKIAPANQANKVNLTVPGPLHNKADNMAANSTAVKNQSAKRKDTLYNKAANLAVNGTVIKNPAVKNKLNDKDADAGKSNQLDAATQQLANNITKGNKPAIDTLYDSDKTASANNKTQNNLTANKNADSVAGKAADRESKKQMAIVKASALKNRPQFSITVLAASDANAVNSFGHSQTGTNYGLQLSLRLTRKLTISTGAAYAIKPYATNLAGYSPAYAPPSSTTNIQANCKVLDIPLNLSYQLYSHGNNVISLGTGVSSYFMLRENYRYDYTQESGLDPKYIEIKNQNKHLFGVLNINANYQRRINSKFSAVIQPYMKLPLTGIGNGKVDLKSTGIALGVNWNIGSAFGAK